MYDIELAAAELLLEPADLQEIYRDFFLEAGILLANCEAKMAASDFDELRKTMHAVKGVAANLRMGRLVQLTRQAEQTITEQNISSLCSILTEIRCEIERLREQIDNFYPMTKSL